MRTTIDKAGRVVIPGAVRDRAGFAPGTALEISVDEFGIRLERVAPGPRLVRIGKYSREVLRRERRQVGIGLEPLHHPRRVGGIVAAGQKVRRLFRQQPEQGRKGRQRLL